MTGQGPLLDPQLPTTSTDAEASEVEADVDSFGYGSPPLEAAGRRRAVRRWMQLVVLALPVAMLAIVGWSHRSMFFDGYIYLHVVQNLLAGHGPVFNAGQRVEAFTSPLWTYLLALTALLTPFSLPVIAVDLGLACTVSGLAIAVVASTRLVRRVAPDAFLLPLGAMVFASVPAIWSLATLGLETGLTLLWLGCCSVVLVRWAGNLDTEVPRWGLVVLGLGPLVRPELGLDTLVFIVILLVVDGSRRRWAGRMALVAWAFALPVAYELFRMAYYGMVVANTAVAKEASLPRPATGISYLTDFTSPYWLFVPAVALAVGAFLPLVASMRRLDDGTRNRWALVALPLAAVLNAAYITIMGGDYVHARLLVAPLFALCAPVAVVPMTRKYLVALVVIPWALVCMFTLRSVDGSPSAANPFVLVTGHGTGESTAVNWGSPQRTSSWLTAAGIYVQADPRVAPLRIDQPPATGLTLPTVATFWAGTGPYELGTDVQILDLMGLADPLDAHMQLIHRGQFTGHEKPLPTPWVVALLTAPGSSAAQVSAVEALRPSQYTPLISEATGKALDIQTAWARAALQCPLIHDIAFGADRPLTFGLLIGDITHAVARSTVRIPADPQTAYHRFCGPGTPASVVAAEG